jgi:PPK2 family polyphosphate:nucleotide phosphotransferase
MSNKDKHGKHGKHDKLSTKKKTEKKNKSKKNGFTHFDSQQLRVKPGSRLNLSEFDTRNTFSLSEDQTKKETKKIYKDLLLLQEKMHAQKKHRLLIVLQAMDAAGKDSTIRKLTLHLNIHGARVESFGKPTKHELARDFLWRIHKVIPRDGEIVFFNRSHYEDVLIVKVHGWCDQETIDRRYDHINNFESLLADDNTKVVKFMLHVSPEYQLSRFKRRLDNPEKHWKFNPADLDEREHWQDYMQAFEFALERCSTESAPWYVIPAENRWFRDYAIARILQETLESMGPEYPDPDYDESLYHSENIE